MIQDTSITRKEILGMISEGLGIVASSVYLPTLTVTAELTVSAGATVIDLPEDYLDKVYHVRNASSQWHNGRVRVVDRLTDFLSMFQHRVGASGNVIAVCVQGKQLRVVDSPTEDETLEFTYRAMPEEIMSEYDEPECIPLEFQHDTLVNYAAYRCFDLIEDGVTDQKRNTQHYFGLYQTALAALFAHYGVDDARPLIVESEDDVWERRVEGGWL